MENDFGKKRVIIFPIWNGIYSFSCKVDRIQRGIFNAFVYGTDNFKRDVHNELGQNYTDYDEIYKAIKQILVKYDWEKDM